MMLYCRWLTKLFLWGLLGLTGANALPQVPKRLTDRIAAVENSLIPYVPVDGLAGWNLLERMRYHQVAGVSVAVIHNY